MVLRLGFRGSIQFRYKVSVSEKTLTDVKQRYSIKVKFTILEGDIGHCGEATWQGW